MYKILFVCTGNICRSPTAEGVLRHHVEKLGLAERVKVDSAGTHGYHIGEAPDHRSVATARKAGIFIDGLMARQVCEDDFREFDLILACDYAHLSHLRRMAPKDATARVELFLDYVGLREKEVPDPYYGGQNEFDYVLDLIESGITPLIAKFKGELR